MVQKIQGAQRDFSFGEVDVALKRSDDHPARKAGLRQMANARILNSGGIQDRSGRRALYPMVNAQTRVEEFTLSAGNIFKIEFAAATWIIRNAAGTIVASATLQGNGAALPWTGANASQIRYAILGLNIYLAFAGMRPQVITWDGVATWSFADYTEAILASGQKRTPFYRITPQNITMQPTSTIGAINLIFSAPIITTNAFTGTRMRFCGRQVLLGAVVNNFEINATVIEPLPPGQQIALTASVGNFAIGDEVIGTNSGAIGIVTASPSSQSLQATAFIGGNLQVGDSVAGTTSGAIGVVTAIYGPGFANFNVVLLSGTSFVAGELIAGPHGSVTSLAVSTVAMTVQLLQNDASNLNVFNTNDAIVGPSGHSNVSSVATVVPQAVSVWDDEIMNGLRGFPASVFVDQFRLGFCDFPPIPGGILWSAINSPTDAYANDASSPDNAIFEITPGKVQVYDVVPGPEGSEFIFCDTKIYYIPISATTPLVPGSVGFQLLSGDGAAPVQPRLAQEAILYANAGQNSINAVIATGSITRPFNTKQLSEFHQHLFTNIRCIAAPNADGTFAERYAYVLNNDGSIAVGKYQAETLQGNSPVIGWGPWSGGAAVSWIAAWNADVLFTSTYFGQGICEILDDTQYLDCALPVNSLPASFAPPGGKGPLWFIPNHSVTLMDQVTRNMGTYQIDVNGFIIPQFNGGENLAIASLVAGQPWTMTVEPFAPDAQPGADMGQRMNLRSISRIAVYVINSTGFMLASLFSAKQTLKTPPLGTIQQFRRVPAWNQGENVTLPPPLRETVESWPAPGSSYDPRAAIIKDSPGPLQILEIGMEVSI